MSRRWIHRLFLAAYPKQDRPGQKFCQPSSSWAEVSFILPHLQGQAGPEQGEQDRKLLRHVAWTPLNRPWWNLRFSFWNFSFWNFSFAIFDFFKFNRRHEAFILTTGGSYV